MLSWENESWNFYIPQWMPPNVKIDIKILLPPLNFILQNVLDTAPDSNSISHFGSTSCMTTTAYAYVTIIFI